ncbi:scavenger receptor class B member 1 isoform X1 [Nilaparvata lugens]|uniref:scavenger receptor class B member 1 isoform X1 n=1 Tax=Nilaparvata lugens TaxID=108931 RepID=UPI00193E14FA|nr:scavenger receptor class B member 1 isoform X1 [Nilaparvata lugens]
MSKLEQEVNPLRPATRDERGFFQANLRNQSLSAAQDKARKNESDCAETKQSKKKKKIENDCLNLKRTLLMRSSPKMVILKSAEDLCGKGFPTRCPKVPTTSCDPKFLTTGSFAGLFLTCSLGAVIVIIASISFIWTPFEILMNERLRMVRGLPAYEWWLNPPDEVLLRVYLFNITNSEKFLNGTEKKLKLEEIGPYIFREKLTHSNVQFFENGTMTYRSHRTAIFLPEMNHLSLNATIIVPNLAVLGMSSYLWDSSFVTKIAFNLLLNRLDSQPIVASTVNNYFWNFTDPLVKVAKTLAPHLVPVENMGILQQIYHKFSDDVTVYFGPGNGRRFFTIDKFNGQSRLGYWPNETCDTIQGSTEGVTYHQGIKRDDVLKYLRKTICRVTPLHYTRDVQKLGMKAYQFDLPADVYMQPTDGITEQCFNHPGSPDLPSGVIDASPCNYDFPVGVSFPHFMNADKVVHQKLEGLNASPEKHSSFVIVEPTTGIPMESRARSQSNVIMRSVSGIPRVKRFSDMFIPMFWAEYNQVGLPWYITALMYSTVIILPASQFYISISFLLLGLSITSLALVRIFKLSKSNNKTLCSYSSLDLLPPTPSTASEC